MFKAVGRLVLIAFFVVFGMVLVVLSLRAAGSGQQYAPVEHPLMNQNKWAILEIEDPAQTKNSKPDFILYLKLYLSKDSEWVVYRKNTVTNQQNQLLPLNALTAAELETLQVPKLETVMTQNPNSTFFLFIEDSSVRAFDKISALVKKYKLSEKILIGSNYQIVLTEVRKLEPLWLYSASTPEISKLRFFTSLFIEPLATTNSDFIVLSDEPNERLVAELHKRKRRFIYKPKNENINAELSHKSDGLISKDANILQQIVDHSATAR